MMKRIVHMVIDSCEYDCPYYTEGSRYRDCLHPDSNSPMIHTKNNKTLFPDNCLLEIVKEGDNG
jgi:hypothetical protein